MHTQGINSNHCTGHFFLSINHNKDNPIGLHLSGFFHTKKYLLLYNERQIVNDFYEVNKLVQATLWNLTDDHIFCGA